MKIVFHQNFEKRYTKLAAAAQWRVKERLALFLADEFDPILNNHPLRGAYKGYRSINIAGDLRAIYKFQSIEVRIFVTLGTHGKLYK